jgi:hypothetical protein
VERSIRTVLNSGLQKLSRRQVPDQPTVGSKEVIAWQLFQLDPLKLLENAILKLPSELMHGKELQIHSAAMTIVVANVSDLRTNFSLNPKLFVQLPCEGLFGAFASLNLSTRELPLQRHRLVGAALADQNFAATNNQRGRDKTKCGSGRPRMRVRMFFFHALSVIALNRLQAVEIPRPLAPAFGEMKNNGPPLLPTFNTPGGSILQRLPLLRLRPPKA